MAKLAFILPKVNAVNDSDIKHQRLQSRKVVKQMIKYK